MKRMGIFMCAIVIAFLLATFNANNAIFAGSCCGIEEGAKKVSTDEKTDNDCPVCGKAADSKGQQKDVEHGGKTAHLCCEGCANAYNENPDKYSKAEESSEEHPKPEHPRSEHPTKKKERGAGYY